MPRVRHGFLSAGKAHALGLLSRQVYLAWLSSTVINLVVSPLFVRALNMWFGSMGIVIAAKADARQKAEPRRAGNAIPQGGDSEHVDSTSLRRVSSLLHRHQRGAV